MKTKVLYVTNADLFILKELGGIFSVSLPSPTGSIGEITLGQTHEDYNGCFRKIVEEVKKGNTRLVKYDSNGYILIPSLGGNK